MRLVALLAVCASLGVPSIGRAQVVLFSDGFENDLSNWTTTGFWSLQTIVSISPCTNAALPFPEGQFCAYYGSALTCSYDSGDLPNEGALTLAAPILIPAAGPTAHLRCWTFHEAEPCDAAYYDRFDIEVSADGGANWTRVGRRCLNENIAPNGVWSGRSIDLTPYLGQSILVRFRFDTVDEVLNGFMGALVDRVEILQDVGTVFCASTCGCVGPFNSPPLGYGNMSGCGNSASEFGELIGQGTPSIANDTVVLNATELLPHTVALLIQSQATTPGAIFGNGRLCLSGNIVRMGARVAAGGTSFPGPSDPPLSVRGQIPSSGGTRHYQVYYRDGEGYCTPTRINLTNGYTIHWVP